LNATNQLLPLVVKTADGKGTFTIDVSRAPELKDWTDHKLAPVVAEWYPKIVALLPGPDFIAPTEFNLTIQPMAGVAHTAGTNISASSTWLEKEINGEAAGALVHELVHVAQHFGHNPHNPGWLVEGSADYIRWFKYEPASHGADIVWMRRFHRTVPRYQESYRVTANFLNWVTEKYDAKIVGQLNAAMRAGNYDDGLWPRYTGKTAAELGEEWSKAMAIQLAEKTVKTGDSQ
jgi:hypothetical protein